MNAEVGLGVIGVGVLVVDGVTVEVRVGGTNWVGVGCKVGVGRPGDGDGPGVALRVGPAVVGWPTVTGKIVASVGVTLCCDGWAIVRRINPRQ